MTVRLSNLQFNALQAFQAQSGTLTLDDFRLLDQRITSGLGRRKVPYLKRISGDRFTVTPEAREAMRMFESTDVFRKVANTTIAHVFDHTPHRLKVVHHRKKRAAA